ncbi:double-strand break repair protein AddB [Roseisalinus antarcticus]|uniref:PD-(D/E)XK nuclease superfamily protein n=1 Tax=Roseisalinus antarcticus TaxID=254357 RepID=A0A1Y5S3A4_9RHOB|nr:double-strand break repair protein AddB [Roseisalinus antarcticus]SLN30641.1 PD-(D/E)XK nuclease superfamily protein [Roseisalinus antarcticus]
MIFDDQRGPRVFGLPPGVDFGAELVRGLTARAAHLPPEKRARIELYVNTARMQRYLRNVWDRGPATLLPRMRLVTDLAEDPVAGAPPPAAPMARRFQIMRLVAALLDSVPDIAPRAALHDLAESLAALLDEMEVEGVAPGTLAGLDGTDQSEHWQTALQFLQIVEGFMAEGIAPGPGRRLRERAEALTELWRHDPPDTPVIVAGSTASRGSTALLMQAVARLPQGALVLPGFDFDLPAGVWAGMDTAMEAEDHPQFRFKRLLDALEIQPRDVMRWTDVAPAQPARNRLVSLAMRPAPVTDAWLDEGPALGDLRTATLGLTLIEAPSPRAEAETIALGLRAAIERGQTAALITPDRMLTRQVAAALDRWDIVPDDSAGQPLPLSPPGRFLRQVLGLLSGRVSAADLLALLKHPLCHGGAGRNRHLLATRAFELHLRRNGPAHPDGAAVLAWGMLEKATPEQAAWAAWLAPLLDRPRPGNGPVSAHLAHHLALAEALSAGQSGSGPLWEEVAGREARTLMTELATHGDAAGPLTPDDYATLFAGTLQTQEVRNPDTGDPRVLIWGTLESRVQGADLVILGGLNDGTWPENPQPDPWLNRKMRAEAGLTLPERRIGLSAHDFQQAVAGAEVWISRARRSDDAETVPSRWLNRLTNLLGGLIETHGPQALDDMRRRGETWVAQAAAMSAPTETVPAAIRPAPRPPVDKRPTQISVTEVQTLIRDPYAVYAKRVLGLRVLDPLVPAPDAPLRGTILHDALEAFVKDGPDPADAGAHAALMAATEAALAAACPWPAHRRLWAARMARVAGFFLQTEVERRAIATPEAFETWAEIEIATPRLTLKGKADRIDRMPDGRVILYDYKTGTPPSEKQQQKFDKQLLLEAAMTSRGGFREIGRADTALARFIGLGGTPKIVDAPLEETSPDVAWQQFLAFMTVWTDPAKGYPARLTAYRDTEPGDYDHLARFGEWDVATHFTPEDLT